MSNNTGNRANTTQGMQRHQGSGTQSSSEENKNWRGNSQQPTYRMRNIELEEEKYEEAAVNNEEQTSCNMGNEKVSRS